MSGVSQAKVADQRGEGTAAARTCDIFVQNVVLLDDVVNQLPGVLIDDQHFPLRIALSADGSLVLGGFSLKWAAGDCTYVAARGLPDGA